MKNRKLKIKVCGMKYADNIQQIALLSPDYLGFIFYPKSPRNFDANIPRISDKIKKTGVFVNAELDFVISKVKQHGFKAIQLHGSETAEYCEQLKKFLVVETEVGCTVEVFKVFGIKDSFDFSVLTAYENSVDYFLFDTKGKAKGGNGYAFDWGVLRNYPSSKPIILSGGIGVEELDKIEQILKTDLPIYGLDLNSKFELKPALKDVELLESFFEKLKKINIKLI